MIPSDVRVGRPVRDTKTGKKYYIVSSCYYLRGVPFVFMIPNQGPSFADIHEIENLEVSRDE